MEQLTQEVQVEKDAYELGCFFEAMIETFVKVKADGWQPGQDVPALLTTALAKGLPALDGITNLKAAWAEGEFAAVIHGVSLPLTRALGTILK